MATKLIDFIQSEQITKLEEDVNILKDKLNLLIADINQLAPKLAPIVSNLNAAASSIGNNYDPTNLTRHRTWRNGTPFHSSTISTDGVLKRLTDFDTYYTEHISKKFPPVVDIRGGVHVGYHVDHNTTSAAMEHAHPEGWAGSTGTCLSAWVRKNPNYPSSIPSGVHSNVMFQALASNTYVPNNTTYAGLREWDAFPKANLTNVNQVVMSADFRLDVMGGSHANNSYGYGWSTNDELMSLFGATYSGTWQPAYLLTVISTGSQLEARPQDNTPTWRTPHGYLTTYNLSNYGDDAPGVGGPAEPAPPLPSLGAAETSTHNIMDPSNQLDDQQYITTVLNTGVVPSYLTQAQILFMSDENKIKRAKQLVLMTRNKLRDDSLWKTENVSDGVLTADDFIT